MIEELLCVSFPADLDLAPNNYSVERSYKSGVSVFADKRSCEKCISIPERKDRIGCEQEHLIVDFKDREITVVNFEQFASEFDSTGAAFGERCDYLLVDDSENHSKIAFCELVCAEEKWMNPNDGFEYPEGKVVKAMRQMISTLNGLKRSYSLKHFIYTVRDRVFILGWREYGAQSNDAIEQLGGFAKNVQDFCTTPSSTAQQLTTSQTFSGYDFTFVRVKYPSVYEW